ADPQHVAAGRMDARGQRDCCREDAAGGRGPRLEKVSPRRSGNSGRSVGFRHDGSLVNGRRRKTLTVPSRPSWPASLLVSLSLIPGVQLELADKQLESLRLEQDLAGRGKGVVALVDGGSVDNNG